MMLSKRNGQAIAEYVIIFAAVTAGALIAFGSLMGGGRVTQTFQDYVSGADNNPPQTPPPTPTDDSQREGGGPGGDHRQDRDRIQAQ